MANNNMKSQLERFNNRAAKSAAMNAVEGKAIEARIAEELEQKKSLHSIIATFERSMTIMSEELRQLRQEKEEFRAIRQENEQLKSMMAEIIQEVKEIRKVTVGSLYMDDEKKRDLGMQLYQSPLHRWRAQQIKEKGFFVDPTPEDLRAMGYPAEDAVEEVEVLETPAASTPTVSKGKDNAHISMPRGRRPGYVLEALEYIKQYTLESGRYNWKDGGSKLMFAILAIAEWRGVNITSGGASQNDEETRKVFQQFAYNKEKYGFSKWTDVISGFAQREWFRR